jgi:hypothetical protein
MTELKAHDPVDIQDFRVKVYLKYEADEVIAHHKFKRCLDKAEMCKARYDEEDAKVNGYGASWDYESKEMKYWERWHKRWLKLAEKFKEEST